jgi:hypothetical protein
MMLVLSLLHTPPAVASLKWVVVPGQTVVVPVMGAIAPPTVIVTTLEQIVV